MEIISVNPATGNPLKKYRTHSPGQTDLKIKKAFRAFSAWSSRSIAQRAVCMMAASQVLEGQKMDLARLMALEMGKPLSQGIAELEKSAWACKYFAEHAAGFLEPRAVVTDALRSSIVFEPLGVVLAVMPWNFPFWQVFRFAAPALMAGNGAILKHASNVPGCALALEKIFAAAGFPPHLFQTLLLPSSSIPGILSHPLICAVTLTGSTEAGRAVARHAGSLLKKTVLELGGSDAYIILADADIRKAAEIGVNSRLINNGESCIAAKRFIVVPGVAQEFEREFISLMSAKKMGDPLHEGTDIGPLARMDLRDRLHRQVRKSIRLGAICSLGGVVPEGPGAYYPPTVLTGVKKGMPAYDEELFGPVAAIIRAKDEQDAIRLANDSRFGLGAAVFTQDKKRGEAIASGELQAGSCFVNAPVKSDPRLPFGGIKQSGYGRELGEFGIHEFVNIKTVFVQ